ncbi:YALI0F07128p [Yarrowia lipolytica CLIB122]|uniref:YALI0F07128p n=2 Tax=Yarrowia lipolytica TaxID=4952 RepID=Q6C2K4_YARLI|nr:YALI0F07128p [Yarrowia lipolytica CLIB122]AOW06794.1 hypothetical protein YALI1_F10530g [Yarrowia lipolytica]KAB8284133.1 hypothetical protein BKA91DRAFT_96339 [Yarrowia lipolytica]KAE8168923.1 hypothetical protein BKA90DRAFT_177118 [Yarrowia lipolytica]KAJ8056005.1 hypothetical protein LXG23DRAFT_57537 [Yarrowia lipolytica]RMI97712.1 hypothetical protein BD777DRAFT_41659 [Yarrowia lipolytica]|eukprot:XP_505108.1 YALI0F07128p [Yarrowia lipolytica CLIB122]
MSQADIDYIKEYRAYTPGAQLFDSLDLALKYIKAYRTHEGHHIIQLRSTYRKVHGVYKDVFRVDFQCNCGGSFIVKATGRRMGCPFRGKIVQYKNTQHWRLIFEVNDAWQKNYQDFQVRKSVQIMFAINGGKTNRQILDQLTHEARVQLEQDGKKKITDKLVKQAMPLEDYTLEDMRRRMAEDPQSSNMPNGQTDSYYDTMGNSFVDLGMDTTLADIDSDQTEDEAEDETPKRKIQPLQQQQQQQQGPQHISTGLTPKSTFKRPPLQELSANTPKRPMTKPTPMPMSIDSLHQHQGHQQHIQQHHHQQRAPDEAFSLAITAFFQSWTASGYRPDQIPPKYNPFIIPTEQQPPPTPLASHGQSQNHYHTTPTSQMPPLQSFSSLQFPSFDTPPGSQSRQMHFW